MSDLNPWSYVFWMLAMLVGGVLMGYGVGHDAGVKEEKLRAKAEREAQNGENLND